MNLQEGSDYSATAMDGEPITTPVVVPPPPVKLTPEMTAAAEEMYQFILLLVQNSVFEKHLPLWMDNAVDLLSRAKPVKLPG